MLHRDRVEREYARLYRELGLGTTIWSPLASGMLTGKYDAGLPRGTRASLPGLEWLREELVGKNAGPRVEKSRRLQPIADSLGCTRAQLAIAWCLKNPNVSSVITGASRREQVEENLGALNVVPALTPGVMETIEGVLDNAPAPESRYR
jgi:aryl-alcohol dehydrogenase-like predicted oxidoreductase